MTDKLSIVWRYIEDSDANNNSTREDILRSDDYYYGRLPAGAAEGRSQSVSMDVQSMVVATQASVLSGFTNGQPARFDQIGDDDDQQAGLESTAVNDAIMTGSGYLSLSGAIENALRYHNAIMRCFVETDTIHEKRVLPEATAQQLASVVANIPEQLEPVIKGDTVTWTRQVERLVIETIETARVRYIKDFPEMNAQEMPFVAIQHRDLRKDLVDMGFDKAVVEDLPPHGEGVHEESIRSKFVAEERSHTNSPVPELDWIEWFECWVQIPQGDGTTALERIATSNRKMLDNTPATFVPLAFGAAFPQSGRVQGISLANKIIPIAVSKSEARRQYEDNLAANNNPRSLVFDCDLDDALNGRVDGVVRASSPNARYEPIVVQDLTGGSLAYLQYMDTVRAEVGGAALDMQQPEQEALKSQIGAVAVQSVLMSQEQMSVFIANNMANTLLKQLWLIVHRTLREDFTGTLTVRQADQAVQVQPRDWQSRTLVTMLTGMSPTERNRKAANLMTVIQTQMGLMQSGMPLTDPNGLHAALRDWGWASDLNMSHYITDPDSPKGQQAAQQQSQQAQQQQQQQQQMLAFQAQLEQAKIAMDKYKADLSAQVDVFEANLQAEVDEAKLTLEGIENAQRADIDRAQAAGDQLGQNNGAAGS